jgi:prepilin-type processing-associated H-X9-DG protein
MRIFKWIAVVILLAGALFLARAIQEAREAALVSACHCHIHCVWHAIQSYEIEHGHYPPAYVLGPDGKPWHSWRVLILPHLQEDDLYAKYRFDEPWNGPNNSKLAGQIFTKTFACPDGYDHERTANTNYVLVVGEGTAFPGDKTTTRADIRDGEANTLMLVEVGDAGIHWMEPRDLPLDALQFGTSRPNQTAISSTHPHGPNVVFADGRYQQLRHPLRPETLRALGTIAGGEDVTKDVVFGDTTADPTCR